MVTKDSIPKTNRVFSRETKRGIEIWAYHPNKKKNTHIGTIPPGNLVYIKGLNAGSLLGYGKAASLFPKELEIVESFGTEIFIIERSDTGETHAIDLETFKKNMTRCNPGGYGMQMKCDLYHFQTTKKKAKRNAILNNPPKRSTEGFQRPRPQQLLMFQVLRRDKSGQYY